MLAFRRTIIKLELESKQVTKDKMKLNNFPGKQNVLKMTVVLITIFNFIIPELYYINNERQKNRDGILLFFHIKR